MKKLYVILFLAAAAGCGKGGIKETQEDLVILAMTSGQWKVTNFTRGGTDVTTGFGTYQFQFRSNFTVDAINGGSLEKTGSWNADADARTISSSFTNAAEPLSLLNGTWNITSNTWTSVNATQTIGSEVRTLRLDKL